MNPWVRFLVTFFFGFLGVHKFIDHKTGMGILYIFTGGLFGIGWLIDTIQSLVIAIRGLNQQEEYQQVEYRVGEHHHTPKMMDGFTCTYTYDDVEIFCPADVISTAALRTINTGSELTLQKEPENEYDVNAVAVYLGTRKIGYLHRNQLQDMANDYIARDWPIRTVFECFIGDQNASVSIDYYRPDKRNTGNK